MAQLTEAHEAGGGGLCCVSMGSPEKVPPSPTSQTKNLYPRETLLGNVPFDPIRVDRAEAEVGLHL